MPINMSVEYGKLHDENVKLRMINDSLLNALKKIADCENEINIVTGSDAKGFIRIAKEAIKKAEQ